jgi:hypothetical protein
VIELRQVRVRVHVRVLHHVLGLALVAQNRARRAEHALIVTPHQDLEQGRVAGDDPRHDFLIRQGGGPVDDPGRRWHP